MAKYVQTSKYAFFCAKLKSSASLPLLLIHKSLFYLIFQRILVPFIWIYWWKTPTKTNL